ncbi:MAG: hypothetical protein LBH13_08520 [Cellulomonadaceae bacterium]|jgi:hypothetical protein|nr:hypothetical protein [Cellulomonadaceae bacterium]
MHARTPSRWNVLLAAFAAFAMLATTVFAAPWAVAGTDGDGDSYQGSGGIPKSATVYTEVFDGYRGPTTAPAQGWGNDSINYFWNLVVANLDPARPGSQGIQPGEDAEESFRRVCGDALDNLIGSSPDVNSRSDGRVVGVHFSLAYGNVEWFMATTDANAWTSGFAHAWPKEKASLKTFASGSWVNYTAAKQQEIEDEFDRQINALTDPNLQRRMVCVVKDKNWPEPSTFTPTVSTEATDIINKGAAFSDAVTVNVARNSGETQAEANARWMDDTTLIPHVSVRGPFTTAPTSIPAASTEIASFDCPGFAYARTRTCSGGSAPSSGYYYYHVTIPKHDNTTAAVSAAFDADEITLVRMQPRVQTTVGTATSDKYVNKGATVTDTVTFALVDSLDEWITGTSVTARGRLYGPYSVAGAPNPTAATSNATSTTINNVPSGSGTPVCTVSLTRTSAGTSTSPGCPVASSGYYTWVWDIQDAANYHANIDPRWRFSDGFMVAAESFVTRLQFDLRTDALTVGPASTTVGTHGAGPTEMMCPKCDLNHFCPYRRWSETCHQTFISGSAGQRGQILVLSPISSHTLMIYSKHLNRNRSNTMSITLEMPAPTSMRDNALRAIVELWEQMQPHPALSLVWNNEVTHGKLEYIQEIADLLARPIHGYLTVNPQSGTSEWYTQAARTTAHTYTTEVAWRDASDGTIHNHHISHDDGSLLSRAEAYAVMANFCQYRRLPAGYSTALTQYEG